MLDHIEFMIELNANMIEHKARLQTPDHRFQA
jgi:hypothetical protein